MAERGRGVRTRPAELAVSAGIAALGALMVADAYRLGIAWDLDGPQSGTFPFWTGLVMIAASLAVFATAALTPSRATFATAAQLARVAGLFVPAALFVAAVLAIGLYLPAAALMAWFMTVLGGYRPATAALSGLGMSAAIFVVFETLFLVALPKGPVEALLGY
jgi:putative tricarboxylic transport membrane protein